MQCYEQSYVFSHNSTTHINSLCSSACLPVCLSVCLAVCKHKNMRAAVEVCHEITHTGGLIKYVQTLQVPLKPKIKPNILNETYMNIRVPLELELLNTSLNVKCLEYSLQSKLI
jgi:hypothetical protein